MNPAFVDASKDFFHWKKDGTWIKMEGCVWDIAFGGDGTLYKRDCENDVL